MYASSSFQRVKITEATAYLDLASVPFTLKFESAENSEDGAHYSHGEVTLHLQDADLAADLVEAVNAIVAKHAEAKHREAETVAA